VALLLVALANVGATLTESWENQPLTEVEETDCRIQSMMGGDNPVEVEQMYRACADSSSAAYVAPRVSRFRLMSGLASLVAVVLAGALTWHARDDLRPTPGAGREGDGAGT
jgi:hypothetical protein